MTDDPGANRGADGSAERLDFSRMGWTVRVVVALVGIAVGLLWTARIAIDGSLSSGILFRLLLPLALIYLGISYLGRIRRSTRGDDP